jgi:phage baseplate assembly protein W
MTTSNVYYKGFSTANWLKNKSLAISDIESVKVDLQNHIYTRLGERIMQPSFGTRIPEMAFEQNDEETSRIINEDITRVINYDPRVELISLDILPFVDNNAIVVLVELLYLELNVVDVLQIDVKLGSF